MNIAAGYDGHGDSYGLWSDGTTMWVATDSGWLRAYDLNSGVRSAEFDIRIQTHAMTPGDIWSDGETIWVTNRIGRIDAYRLARGVGRVHDAESDGGGPPHGEFHAGAGGA